MLNEKQREYARMNENESVSDQMGRIEQKTGHLKQQVHNTMDNAIGMNADLNEMGRTAAGLADSGAQYQQASRDLKKKTWREMMKAKLTWYIFCAVCCDSFARCVFCTILVAVCVCDMYTYIDPCHRHNHHHSIGYWRI